MRRVIAAEWQKFAKGVLSGISPESTQYIETRRGFYAGAHAVLDAVASLVSEGDDVTPEDEHVMEDVAAELKEFAADIKAGRK